MHVEAALLKRKRIHRQRRARVIMIYVYKFRSSLGKAHVGCKCLVKAPLTAADAMTLSPPVTTPLARVAMLPPTFGVVYLQLR